ncbi:MULTISPECIES: CHAP domain-containing protein [Actinomadura]|uniref:CHAP domain-containing protein n=1 Tax=Actinomadura yumaensis TaxID=111807 RepID=A0ABW2CX08_9ACTN|nr:CHAP domain-containing protein [Actinomadura sp. J1-007]MWK32913.1 CHAP domain-containing protein [Actinomadura sp. J1-007]
MTGRHRKQNRLSLTLRTTGSLVVGAAVLGTAAATAQAAVVGPDRSDGAGRSAAATDMAAAGGRSTKADPKAGNGQKAEDGARAVPKQAASPRAAAPAGDPESAPKPKPKPEAERPTAAQAIDLARSQVGTEEDGGGTTKFQNWYMSTDRARQTVARDGGSVQEYADAQWCDMFVSWIGERLGFSEQFGSDAWTVAHARWFKEQDRWGTTPKPGAIVFYSWDGGGSEDDIDHVGLVVKGTDDGVEAVEGNTSNAVRVRERSADQIVGYGYPEYAG